MINSFKGKYEFLSNFSESFVMMSGIVYPTVEHAYQASKTNNPVERADIAIVGDPRMAKKLGRKVTIASDWDNIRLIVMFGLVHQKFSVCVDLTRKLVSTRQEHLVEGNYWHDNFFGDCYCEKCRDIPGENHLGRILMKVRDRIVRRLGLDE